jgi:hypothetical protein
VASCSTAFPLCVHSSSSSSSSTAASLASCEQHPPPPPPPPAAECPLLHTQGPLCQTLLKQPPDFGARGCFPSPPQTVKSVCQRQGNPARE